LRVVLIIDEAQELSVEALEQVRLLTNLETNTQKLLQIILLGQPELRDELSKPELRQLAQRITARYHLTPLDRDEAEAYVRHRLAVAGSVTDIFTPPALSEIYRLSGGVPRVINVIADRALMAGYAREQGTIGERLVDRAADETMPGNTRYWVRRYGSWAAAALIALAIAAGAQLWRHRPAPAPVVEAQATTVAPVADPLTQLRDNIAHNHNSDTGADLDAWTQLLARWQVNSSQIAVRDAAKCQPVLAAGLDCLHGFGTIDQIARFDRPMLLILHQGDARTAAMLVDVRGDNVRLEIDGTVHNVKKNELGEVWSGEFMAIWRLPNEVPAALRPGDAGPGVAWVKQQLAMMDKGKSSDAGPAYFDAALEERVRKLQTAYGIKPDGLIGPETLFALSSLDESGPHLARSIE